MTARRFSVRGNGAGTVHGSMPSRSARTSRIALPRCEALHQHLVELPESRVVTPVSAIQPQSPPRSFGRAIGRSAESLWEPAVRRSCRCGWLPMLDIFDRVNTTAIPAPRARHRADIYRRARVGHGAISVPMVPTKRRPPSVAVRPGSAKSAASATPEHRAKSRSPTQVNSVAQVSEIKVSECRKYPFR